MSGLAICSGKKLWHLERHPPEPAGAFLVVEGLLDFWAGALVADQ